VFFVIDAVIKERSDAYGPVRIKEEFSSYDGSVKPRINTYLENSEKYYATKKLSIQ